MNPDQTKSNVQSLPSEQPEKIGKTRADFGESFYLNYGESRLDPVLRPEAVLSWMDNAFTGQNILTEARHRHVFTGYDDAALYSARCDFCGMPMTRASAEQMPDGRIRCETCSKNQIESQEEFGKLFAQCKEDFQAFFQVRLPEGIHVHLCELPDRAPGVLELVPITDPSLKRRMSIVEKTEDGYDCWIENGISRLACMQVLVCAFTLIWQNENWDNAKLQQLCQQTAGKNGQYKAAGLERAVKTGMALWAGTEYLHLISEDALALRYDRTNAEGHGEESIGYRYYKRLYPFAPDPQRLYKKPFHGMLPVDLARLEYALENSR